MSNGMLTHPIVLLLRSLICSTALQSGRNYPVEDETFTKLADKITTATLGFEEVDNIFNRTECAAEDHDIYLDIQDLKDEYNGTCWGLAQSLIGGEELHLAALVLCHQTWLSPLWANCEYLRKMSLNRQVTSRCPC
jgi:hypothetical protein